MNSIEYRLIDVVNLKSGTTVKKGLERESGDVAYIKVSGMNLEGNEVKITTSNTYLNHEDITSKNILPIGTTIFPKRGGAIATNKKRLTEIPLCVDLNTMGAIPKSELVIPLYIYFYFQSFDLLSISNGTTIPQINNYSFDKLKIFVPQIPEQKRIVALLDTVFSDLEQARAKTEQNLKNARELFDSYLQQVFSEKGGSIKLTELGEVVDVLTDYHANGSYKVLKQHVELSDQEDFAWIVRSTDFENKFKNNKRYISEGAYNYLTKSKLFGGEIIMSKIGNAGKVYLMPETDRACSLAMNLFLIRLDATKANNEYVYRYLNSSSGKAQIAPRLKGAATQTITKDNVRSLLIPLPSLVKQEEHILAIQELEVETKALETLYSKKLDKIDELKKSILQKAFSGELTAPAE